MKISGNKGEWSEFYVLLRLLADGKLSPDITSLPYYSTLYLPIISIFRSENRSHHIEYKLNGKAYIELYLNNAFIKKISVKDLENYANFILNAIKNGKGNGSFSIEGSESIMDNLCCKKIKADSRKKVDITIKIHDPITNFHRVCGYSIKSDLGNSPTLLNASESTNFKFEVLGVEDSDISFINNITKNGKTDLISRLQRIPDINFTSVNDKTFSKNLLFIDTQMATILAEMLKIFYRDNISCCAEIATLLGNSQHDPLNLHVENLYRHKIKKFLCAIALGLTPTEEWNGLDEANGGYIIVKENGDISAYHLYDRDNFETYLLNNTKLEKGSSHRHNFGSIYIENGKKFINLNLQIRFKKVIT